MKKIKVIGLGGIGSHLIEPLCLYANQIGETEIVLIDGDSYENKNRSRQVFDQPEVNKATATFERLSGKFQNLHFKCKTTYVNESNIISFIRENDIIMLCVDNHATRKLVSNRCQELNNIVLISGGNDYSDGNVICYRKVEGVEHGRTLTQIDPKIAVPEDQIPGTTERSGCQEETEQFPQLITANFTAAAHMLNVYAAVEKDKFDYEQVYFDTISHRSRPSPEKSLEINFE